MRTAQDNQDIIDALEKEIASLKNKLAIENAEKIAEAHLRMSAEKALEELKEVRWITDKDGNVTQLKTYVITELEEEVASLKEQLKREQECVDFYADISNWSRWDTLLTGGKLARATQARREK